MRYKSAEDILKEHYDVRLAFYATRKRAMIEKITEDLQRFFFFAKSKHKKIWVWWRVKGPSILFGWVLYRCCVWCSPPPPPKKKLQTTEQSPVHHRSDLSRRESQQPSEIRNLGVLAQGRVPSICEKTLALWWCFCGWGWQWGRQRRWRQRKKNNLKK